MLLFKILFSFIFSFLITLYLVPFFCSLAHKWEFVDVPDGKIKKHTASIPYMGGVAIYCGFLMGLAFTMPFENRIYLLLVGTMLLLFIGLIDDLFILKPYQKFFGQCIVALCFLKAGFYLKEHIFYNIWNMPLSFLWILTIINSFNLVDVMDGLATLIAINATISLVIIAALLHQYVVVILLNAFLGSLCGFLWYNRPSAQIYLGDAGSLFIGGFLAIVPFFFDWGTYNRFGYLTPIIIFAIPLLECVSLILIRWYKKIPFYQGSPDHFSCYLQSQGWKKEQVLYYVLLLSIFLGSTAISFSMGKLSIFYVSCLGVCFLTIWIGFLCKRPYSSP